MPFHKRISHTNKNTSEIYKNTSISFRKIAHEICVVKQKEEIYKYAPCHDAYFHILDVYLGQRYGCHNNKLLFTKIPRTPASPGALNRDLIDDSDVMTRLRNMTPLTLLSNDAWICVITPKSEWRVLMKFQEKITLHNIPNCMKEVTWIILCPSTNGHRSAGLGWLPFIKPTVFVQAAMIRSW